MSKGMFMTWFVYIVKCSNGSYYTGHTQNLVKRLDHHLAGTGAQHTRQFQPSEIVFHESFQTEADSINREKQIKGWSRAKKEALIRHDLSRLKHLSQRHDPIRN